LFSKNKFHMDLLFHFFKILFIYLSERESTSRGEQQAEGEAAS